MKKCNVSGLSVICFTFKSKPLPVFRFTSETLHRIIYSSTLTCMRRPWYTSRLLPPRASKTRTVLSYEAVANSRPEGEKERSMTAIEWSQCTIRALSS